MSENTSSQHSSHNPYPVPNGEPEKTLTVELPKSKDGKPKRGWLSGLGALLLLGLSKFKYLWILLKSSKVLITGLSMLGTVFVYALMAPWQFAIGFVLLIFIHEMGHLLVLRYYGMPFTAPVFIPFVGAMIGMKSMPHSAEMEALVGYGGPLLGTVAAFVCYIIFQQTGWLLFLMLAQVGFLLNLFNLIPVSPMDGGRVTAAISRWFWLLGLGVILAYFIYGSHHPILLIVLILGAIRVFKSFFGREPELDESYYAIAPARRIMIALAYFGLVAVLAYMSLLTHAQVESLVKF